MLQVKKAAREDSIRHSDSSGWLSGRPSARPPISSSQLACTLIRPPDRGWAAMGTISVRARTNSLRRESSWGASINDVHRSLGFFDPLPPYLSAKSILFTRRFRVFFYPLPLLFRRHIWKPPPNGRLAGPMLSGVSGRNAEARMAEHFCREKADHGKKIPTGKDKPAD